MKKPQRIFLLTAALLALSGVMCTLSVPAPPVVEVSETAMRATLDTLQATLSVEQQISRATVEAWMTEVSPVTARPGEQDLPAMIETGTIKGSLTFPGGEKMFLRVTAVNIDSGEYYSIETDHDDYTLVEVPVGQYHVLAFRSDGDSQPGAYTAAVLCGLGANCTDHNLAVVEVKAGEVASGVDPVDWPASGAALTPQP